MRKLSTQCMDDLEKKVKSAPEAKSSPRKQTMDFLKQLRGLIKRNRLYVRSSAGMC